jgi:hypothetical protein
MAPRSLPLRHMAKLVLQGREGVVEDPEKLGPDMMRLYSFYRPSLVAGDYTIEVQQSITATVKDGSTVHTQSLVVTNTRDGPVGSALQQFEVVVPRFSLDPSLINSYYPPSGHQDEGRVLPHIVLNDPHYPWEIPAGVTQNMDGIIDNGRSMVPWVALIVFDPEDLRLPTLQDIQDLKIQSVTDVNKQAVNGTFNMPVNQYFSNTPAASRINYQAGYTNDLPGYAELTSLSSPVDVIFPTKELVTSLFSSTTDEVDHKYGIEAYKYLAHVRNINTVGFPDAGVEEEGLFSIVLSSRTGAFDITQPKTQICHLVSLEHLDSTLGDLMTTPPGGPDRIGLVSLFSWVYTALPPNPVNFVDTMENLTTNQQMLRVDDNLLGKLDNSTDPMKLMSQRLKLGYTLTRWRPETGEETVAFNRGPLVPQKVTWPPVQDLPSSSNTSKEYQILDPQTGLMDLSYSGAWQTGKLLAISDTVFSAALMRFRSAVYNSSAYKTRMENNGMESKPALLAKIGSSISALQTQSKGNTGLPERIVSPRDRTVVPGLKTPAALPLFSSHLQATVASNTSAGSDVYTEFNLDKPNNSDWVVIHSWISNKLALGDIPPQHLIPEPSYLPRESLRFFHIDDFWLDCLLDGALSVANHLDHDDDLIRTMIKETFNVYLNTIVPEAGYKPQIPSYGFLIRSQLIKTMPDLKITVSWTNPDNRAPVCRWTKWDDETLMCLLDREPEELSSIILAQPPHQQRFSLGSHLDATSLTFGLRRLYTKGAPDGEWDTINMSTLPPEQQALPKTWFNWTTRCLQTSKMAEDLNMLLQFGSNNDAQNYNDTIPNSCELGLELNDPSYYFAIVPPPNSNPDVPARNRQLYVQANVTAERDAMHVQLAAKASAVPAPRISLSQKTIKSQAKVVNVVPPPDSHIKPPHQQARVQNGPPPSIHTLAVTAAAASTLQTRYDLLIYPDYKGPPTRYTGNNFDAADFIPTNNLYFYDLVFSIRKKPQFADSQYKLLNLRIDIPTTVQSGSTGAQVSLLEQNYDGPGLRMLSNQRFMPFLYNQDNKLYISVIPRTAADSYSLVIDDGKSSEMSFRLAEANVSATTGDALTWVTIKSAGKPDVRQQVVMVQVVFSEVYSTADKPDGEAVQTTYRLVKKDVTNDPSF